MKYCFTISLSILLIAPVCYGAAVMDSTLTTIIPSAAIVQAVSNSKNNCVINPENGSHTGLEAVFNVKTNGDDNTYDFIISSSIDTLAGTKNAYVMNNNKLYLMLANKDRLPDGDAVSDILSGSLVKNPNIIAYPVINNSVYDIKPVEYNGNLSCKILSGGQQDLNISQFVSNNPLANTYSISEDTAGVYESVIMLNVYRKPWWKNFYCL